MLHVLREVTRFTCAGILLVLVLAEDAMQRYQTQTTQHTDKQQRQTSTNQSLLDVTKTLVQEDLYKGLDENEVDGPWSLTVNIQNKLSKTIGRKYVTCTKRYAQRDAGQVTLGCLCDRYKCALVGNCCPDVKPVPTQRTNMASPKCRQVHDLFYTYSRKNDVINGKSESHTNTSQTLNTETKFTIESEDLKSINKTSANDIRSYLNDRGNGYSESPPKDIRSFNRKTNTAFPFYMIFDSCPLNFTDTFTINMCETETSEYVKDIVPMVSWTGIIYKNRFCAKCHSEVYVRPWQVITNCMYLYKVPSLPATISEVLQQTQGCLVLLEPPTPHALSEASLCKQGDHGVPETAIIERCNTTGLWTAWDNEISQRCDLQNDMLPIKDQQDSNVVYKNIFCYICNSEVPSTETIARKADYDPLFKDEYVRMEIEIEPRVSYGLVMIGTRRDAPFPCPTDMINGVYKEGCLPFRCPPDTISMRGLCLDNTRDVNGLVVSAMIRLKPLFPLTANVHGLGNVTFSHIAERLLDVLGIARSKCELVYIEVLENPKSHELVTKIKIANSKLCSLSDLVAIFEVMVYQQMPLSIPGDSTYHQAWALSMLYTHVNMTMYNSVVKFVDKLPTYEFALERGFYCPSVLFNTTTQTRLPQNHNVRKLIKNVRGSDFISGDDEIIPLCFASYVEQWVLEKFNLKRSHVKTNMTVDVESILTLATSVISIVSIVVVIITYSMFSELRCIPGKLFMVLCLNILIAQSAFVFGISADDPLSVLCKLFGVLIHVFWLSSIFAMQSCLLLMFRNVSHPLENDYLALASSDTNLFAFWYILPCYVLPALLSTANMVVSTVIYSDPYYGYGGSHCFISTPIMKIITFIAPLCLALAGNIVMFGLILFTIRNVATRSINKTKRYEQVSAFFKLSTMTGVFWLFGVLYEASGYRVFDYLFIILNGGQGFLLMWSFMLNKRVFTMFRSLYCRYVHRPQDTLSLSNSSSSVKQENAHPVVKPMQESSYV